MEFEPAIIGDDRHPGAIPATFLAEPTGAQSVHKAARPVSVPRLSDSQRWYVIQSQPHREALAEEHLRRQNFRAFLPLQMKNVRHARKLSVVRAPLFPRYLFVVIDLAVDRWRCINSTYGVTSLVMAEGRPLPLPHGLVETFIRSTNEKGLVCFDDQLKPGQPIRLKAGPFANEMGVLARVDSAGRVELLMQILNGEVRLNVHREWVEPLTR
jgi:transcriptional antiterminator RfaH